MAGPIATYLTTQLAAQNAFSVPFGLVTLVNNSINSATAAGEFNTTVDCSLFTAEDVSNLRIYLDSLGYLVEYAVGTNEKGLLIDWAKFLDIPGLSTTVYQGTSPWIVSGAVTTSPDVNVHDGSGNSINSTSGSLDVDITNTVPVTETNVDLNFGTWAYYAGVSGTVTISSGQRILSITAHSTIGGTITINGGATITLPPNTAFTDNPLGNLTAPTIVFTNTDAYFVEVVS